MKSREQWRIAIAGAGNVAWHMGRAFTAKGYRISQVLNRTESSAKKLAGELAAGFSGRPEDLDPLSDVCLICVSDDAILPVIHKLKRGKTLLIHTAGSVSMDVFQGLAENYGVLYPLQTFTKSRILDYSQIPFLTEGNSPENLEVINSLASAVSQHVLPANSARRLYLHLAAVFASNFSNHMYALAEILTAKYDLSFDLLKPLIAETTAKAIDMSPKGAQTGPAIRGNLLVMQKHLDLLKEDPDLQKLYRMISESIQHTT